MSNAITVKTASSWVDRALRRLGLARSSTMHGAVATAARAAYTAGTQTRLDADWVTSSLSADLELRTSLRKMRQRSRDLANNDPYAERYLKVLVNNVLGPNGIGLQARNKSSQSRPLEDENHAIENAWKDWGRPANCTASGRHTWNDVQDLFLRSLVTDGEAFVLKLPGYAKSGHRFAIQFIDPDQVDALLNKSAGPGSAAGSGQWIPTDNAIKMGVEVDADQRPVAYYVIEGHPSEIGPKRYKRIPAEAMLHVFVPRRIAQTRGVPWMHAAIAKMRQLDKYAEAELVAARIGASKMGFFTSPTGDEYSGVDKDENGDLNITLEPGTFGQLPAGMDIKTFNPDHPNSGFDAFVKTMLRSTAGALGIGYNTLANDLREVNFSSLRSGTLEEREFYRWIQRFLIQHFCTPIFEEWMAVAQLSGKLRLPPRANTDYLDARWRARGWPWVDPLKDAQANALLLENNVTTLEDVCALEGADWEEVLEQRKKEVDALKQAGLLSMPDPKKPTAPGKGGQTGDIAAEDGGQDGEESNGENEDN